MKLKLWAVVFLGLACGGPASVPHDSGTPDAGIPDAGTEPDPAFAVACTITSCDVVGTWDVTEVPDSGMRCESQFIPTLLTFFRDGGVVCAERLRSNTVPSMTSDGGCGIKLNDDCVPPHGESLFYSFVMDFDGAAFRGIAGISAPTCQYRLLITGSRR